MNRFVGTAAVLALIFFVPGAATAEPLPQRAITAEFFVPEDRDNRDIRVATLSLEEESHLTGGLWLRGAAGVAFTEGVLVPDHDPPVVELEADGVGLGGSGFLRWRPVRVARVAPFVEVGFGVLLTTEEFPPSGTFWNFNQRYGPGVDLQLSDRLNVAIAYRHVHYSNGKGFGHPRNPSYDGDGVMFAISWGPRDP